MSFTPFARFRNFTLDNLKALLEVYPDMAESIPWSEAKDYAEEKAKGYKRTAYQQACQLGLEDRSISYFRIHNYLFTFDDENLRKYLVFWFKIYYAPNPYVNSQDDAFLIYCRLCHEIFQSEKHSVNFVDFVEKNIGGKSDDILLNAIKAYAYPVRYRKVGLDDVLYIAESDIDAVKEEVAFIQDTFPITDPKSERDFFERFSYSNFCKFYKISMDPDIKDDEEIPVSCTARIKIYLNQSKECARQIIDCISAIDGFTRIGKQIENNNKSIKINTDELGGNYLRYVFAKESSEVYDNASGGKIRVFTDKDYSIQIGDSVEKCRLSTEWVSSELGSVGTSANYLKALIEVVNLYYSDVLKIYEESGDWYIEHLTQRFILDMLPHTFNNSFAKRYITSLLAKPFVILTGNSGTGKTRIAKQFAEYLEEYSEDGEKNWVLVPVGADWTDNTKILGFYNPLADEGKGKYEETEILRLIKRANENKTTPYFIILDEMNLSHVERYFADFLSHMETRNIPFVLDGYKGSVEYPANVFVVGTVNIDETTYMFSPKVLDRANVIEFKPDEDSVLDLFINPVSTKAIMPANNGTAEAFLKLALSIRSEECGLENEVLSDVQELFRQVYKITEKYGYEFAYRTVKEIRQYIAATYQLINNKESFDLVAAEDEQLLQKILPKIHGNKKEIGPMLEELESLCEQNNLRLSGEKIKQMKGKLATVQYASFI